MPTIEKKPELKAILFDIDGVLIDSTEANRAFYNEILCSLGYRRPEPAEHNAVFHLTAYQTLVQLSGESDQEKLALFNPKVATTRFPNELAKVPVGAQEAVRQLHEKYCLGLVSNRIRRGIDHFFEVFGCAECFATAVSCNDCDRPKPHPDPMLLALEKLGVQPNEAIYVGDASSDVTAGHLAGVQVLGYGPTPLAEADAWVTTFADLVELIGRWDSSEQVELAN